MLIWSRSIGDKRAYVIEDPRNGGKKYEESLASAFREKQCHFFG